LKIERLWSPWRMAFVSGEAGSSGDSGCIFCGPLAAGDDERAGILARGPLAFALLNAFPYNTGHLMVAPLRHCGDLDALTADERAELMELTSRSVSLIREVMNADGFNVGANLGAVAGAGVPGHVHLHVVPRWGGDTNFMPVVGDTKVLPEMLAQTYAKLRPAFDRGLSA
jgi:ATP adenylyltransferase